MIEALLERFPLAPRIAGAARVAARRCAAIVRPERDAAAARVLRAFADEGVVESDFAGGYGYGYDDAARARYESLLGRIMGAERVLARLSLVSGTHAIVTALAALLPVNGTFVSLTGRPYDTLRAALVEAGGSIVEGGVAYDEVALAEDGDVDDDAVAARCARGLDVAFVQRSRGYARRTSLSARRCGELARLVKTAAPNAVVVVDNCYGELVDEGEPLEGGADLIAGSLIKNLGGGLAPGGAYVAGSHRLVEQVARRHYAPGLEAALGPTLGFGRAFVQGLFLAPLAVAETLAGLDFAAALFEELGFEVDPRAGDPRHDIVQAIALGDAATLGRFARGLQRAMPVNARFAPEPGAVPGYAEPVLMSSGAFVPGSTLELSCDAPLRPPYEVYLQGGLLRQHTVLGSLLAAEAVFQESKREPASEGTR